MDDESMGSLRSFPSGQPLRQPTREREAWSLSEGSFDRLLAQLHPDRRQAALKYEAIRSRLVKLFEWRGCRFAEDLADQTMDRVARKLEEGVQVRSEDPYRYFCGVAHYVFKEVLKEQKREREALDPRHWPEPVSEEPEGPDPTMQCLDSCLHETTPRARKLVLEYHQGEKSVRIQNRRRLAEELGVNLNTLRIRVHRMRVQLEACVVQCRERLQEEREIP